MTVLTDKQIAKLMRGVGFEPKEIPTGVAIVRAESGGEPGKVSAPNKNGTYDYGLWQINSVHKARWNQMFVESESWEKGGWANPATNTWFAYELFKARGRGWGDWAAYNNGSYKNHLHDINLEGITLSASSQTYQGMLADALTFGKGGKAVDEASKEAIDSIDQKLGAAFNFVKDGAVTVGVFVLAVVLLILGVWFLLSQSKTARKVAGAVPAVKAVKAVT